MENDSNINKQKSIKFSNIILLSKISLREEM